MRQSFRIVDGVVDLEAAVVVRGADVQVLSPAEALLLEALLARRGEVVPLEDLTSRLWTFGGRSDRLEPLMWSLRRKLAPAARLLVREEDGIRLDAPPGELTLTRRALALVFHDGALDLPSSLEVRPVRDGVVLIADRVEELLAALDGVASDDPLRVAIDVCTTVESALEPALQAAISRLRRLHDWGPAVRFLLSEVASRELHVPIKPVGTWTRVPGGSVESCWALRTDASRGAVAPVPTAVTSRPLTGRADEIATCWAAVEAGAAAIVVHGSAGVGRTTLVDWIAREAQSHLGPSWNVRRVVAAGATDPAAMLRRLATGLKLGAEETSVDAVVRALQALSPLILVVDDLDEASPEAWRALVGWRARASRCTLMCTSRRPLRLPGAMQVELGPLPPRAAREVLHKRTRGLPGWDEVSVDDTVLRELAEAAERLPANLVSLAGRALLMAPELLASSVRHDSTTATRGVLEAACERLPTPLRRALSRIASLPGGVDLDDIESVIDGTGVLALPAVRHLVESGLLAATEDPILAEVRFSVSRTVREICQGRCEGEDREDVLLRHTQSVAWRAQDWVARLESVGNEQEPLRRIALASETLTRAVGLAESHPEVAYNAFRALTYQWERGHVGVQVLLDALPRLQPPPGEEIRFLVDQGRILCDAGRLDEVQVVLRDVPADHDLGPVAHVFRVEAAHGADSRARYAAIASGLLREVRPTQVALLPEMLDALLMGGMFADVAELAERYGSHAAAHGSRWRAAQLGLQAFRARSAMGRHRPQDLRAARQHLQTLLSYEDQRRAAAGLQWLSRALTASGDPRSALDLLDRLGSAIDAHGVWAVRHMARLDRARAHALADELGEAWSAFAEYEQLQAQGPRLPAYVAAFDALMLAAVAHDGARMRQALPALVADGAAHVNAHIRLAALLAPLADHLAGEEVRPLPRARSGGERLMHGLVTAWIGGSTVALEDARAALRQAPEWRSIALVGVALRLLDKAAERALDQNLVAE